MTDDTTCAVALYWSPYLVLTLLRGEEVAVLENPRCRHGGVSRDRLKELLVGFVMKHGPEQVVVETRTARHLAVVPRAGVVEVMAISDARRLLLPGETRATNRAFYDRLIQRNPNLAKFIRRRPNTGEADLSGYWPTARLLAIGLGLAARLLRRSDRHFHS